MRLTGFSFVILLLFSYPVHSQKKVAVIGGGIAGVAATYYIHQYDPQAEITLFEKEAILGGNAQTVEVTSNTGKKCLIDIGPQYFTKGPWDDYIAFLDEAIGIKNIQTEAMAGTLVIQREQMTNPLIVTPLNGKFRGEKLSKLLQLKKFNTEAYKVYRNPDVWRDKSIEQWVETLDFDVQYKSEIIYPFLAASLGTTVADIKKTSTVEIVSLFAFRKPKASNTFQIMQEGMGGLIQKVGSKLQTSGVTIETNAPVQSIKKTAAGYEIVYSDNGRLSTKIVDFIVMAVHADVAHKLVAKDSYFETVGKVLNQFPYFEAHIVLHQDTNFIQVEKPAFLNIFTDKNNELTFSTMNLSLISPRLEGIYKSWMSAEDTQRVKAKGLFLHETTFYHPLITTEFVTHLHQLKTEVNLLKNVCIIGGWTEGLETQNSAVVSAKRALETYKQFKN